MRPPQVESVRDVVDVAQDLRLGGVALGPLPLLLELLREGVRIVHALDVAAGASISGAVTGAPDAPAGLEAPGREPERAQSVQGVEACEPGPDDHRVQLAGPRGLSHRSLSPRPSSTAAPRGGRPAAPHT